MSVSNAVDVRCELDSHANTCAFGKQCLVLATYTHSLDVSGFDPSLGSICNVKVAKVAIAYDCPLNLNTYILIFDQMLSIPSLDIHLLCIDQMRDNGIIVNDVPLQCLYATDWDKNSHCILEGTSGLCIPLEYSRPISFS